MDDKGILTIATGSNRFLELAKNLSRSLRLTNPTWKIALLTDSKDKTLSEFFNVVIPFKEDMKAGFTHKLFMYDYSPFQETLFIDSDSLVVDEIDSLFEIMKVSDVSAQGFKFTDRVWAGVNASKVMKITGAPYLIMHNGGIYYFNKSKKAQAVFKEAKELINRYDEIGFYKLRGKTAHEPLMSTAMGIHNMNAFDDKGIGMRTFVDISSPLNIDVINKRCEFKEFTGENRRIAKPVIVHFSGAHADWFHYKREATKLKMHIKYPYFPKSLLSQSINYIFNPLYIIFIFIYRLSKWLLRKDKMKFLPLMPTLRYK